VPRRLGDGDLDVLGCDAGRRGDARIEAADQGLLGLGGPSLEYADLDDGVAVRAVGREQEVGVVEVEEAVEPLLRRVRNASTTAAWIASESAARTGSKRRRRP
jgi:hypothetical protein